jgi:hypothetical protein
MMRCFRKIASRLHRDDRGLGTVEAVMLIGVGCIILFTLTSIVGIGDGGSQKAGTWSNSLVNMAKSYIFNVNGGRP